MLQVVVDLVEIVAPETATWLGVATSAMSRMGVASFTSMSTWHATEPVVADTLPTIERMPTVVVSAEAMRAAALPILERAPAVVLNAGSISWPWPRDDCLLPSRSELVALDLDVEFDHIDVVGAAGLCILAIACLRLDLVELATELEVLGITASLSS